jgi:hypothetical protein
VDNEHESTVRGTIDRQSIESVRCLRIDNAKQKYRANRDMYVVKKCGRNRRRESIIHVLDWGSSGSYVYLSSDAELVESITGRIQIPE